MKKTQFATQGLQYLQRIVQQELAAYEETYQKWADGPMKIKTSIKMCIKYGLHLNIIGEYKQANVELSKQVFSPQIKTLTTF